MLTNSPDTVIMVGSLATTSRLYVCCPMTDVMFMLAYQIDALQYDWKNNTGSSSC